MNRLKLWVMFAALICGATMFTGCTNDDNPVNPADNLAERILGKWMVNETKGHSALTNEKTVTTFLSDTQAIISMSRTDYSAAAGRWNAYREYTVEIDGNKVTLTSKVNDFVKLVEEYAVSYISSIEMVCDFKHTTFVNDKPVTIGIENDVHYSKVARDYRETILGTWEGHVTNSEGSEFDDGETHRWEYKADGTYVYYEKDGDDWVPYKGNTLNEYFVDGTLLCTRWIDNDVEHREWWEIVSIKDGVMKWKGLRANEDGSTYTATFEMKKVQ
jgi:hypothetical protein